MKRRVVERRVMQRREWLKGTALGAAGAIATKSLIGQSASAQLDSDSPKIEWQMATSWPEREGITYESVVSFCDRIKLMTNGQFVITPYIAGELAPALEVFEAVEAGDVDCAHTSSLYYLDRNPALAFGTTLPFGLTPYQQYAWHYYGGGQEAMQQLHEPFNVVVFPAGTPGVQMGGWSNKEINTLDDLKGLKMRITGFGAKVLERMGVETIALGGDQIYQALADGVVEAAEWQNPHADEQLKLYEVAKYYYYPGWWEPGSIYKVVVSQSKWQQLPKAYQKILRAAAAATNLTTLAAFDAANGEALARLKDKGVESRAYSGEILSAAYETTLELLEETAAESETFAELYRQWAQFRRQIFSWNQVNELSFERFSLQAEQI